MLNGIYILLLGVSQHHIIKKNDIWFHDNLCTKIEISNNVELHSS